MSGSKPVYEAIHLVKQGAGDAEHRILFFADSRIRVSEWQFQGERFLSNITGSCLKMCCFFLRGMGSLALEIFRHNDQCEGCSTHDSQVSLT